MDSMLSKALRGFVSGPLNQLLVNLAGEQGRLWEKEFKRFLRKQPCWQSAPTSGVFRLTVDYGRSLEWMIAVGGYDRVDAGVTAECFPIKGEGRVEFEACYFHFNCGIFSKSAVKRIEEEDAANPWTPARIEHLLAHGATSSVSQLVHPIVGLGSAVWVGRRGEVPFLGRAGLDRLLYRTGFEYRWEPVFRFLAVRPIKS